MVGNDFKVCSYDLILMDCNMPFMDGYESTDKIRSFLYEQNIPQPIILAVTGHTETKYVDKAINCGMNKVLSKPIPTDILKKIVVELNFKIKQEPSLVRIQSSEFRDMYAIGKMPSIQSEIGVIKNKPKAEEFNQIVDEIY